jgi:hypothetical protein
MFGWESVSQNTTGADTIARVRICWESLHFKGDGINFLPIGICPSLHLLFSLESENRCFLGSSATSKLRPQYPCLVEERFVEFGFNLNNF